MNTISIQLPRETLLEILKQIPFNELEAIIRELRVQTDPLRKQLSRPRASVKPFSIEGSPFFALPPIQIGKTSAEELDQIIAEDAYRKD